MVSCEQLASYCLRLCGFPHHCRRWWQVSAQAQDGGPGRQPCLRMVSRGHFGGCYSCNSGGGKYVLLWLFNGEGWGGTETEDTYTSTRKCTHRHTVGTGGGGAGTFRGLGYSGAELSGCGARSVSLKVLKSNNTRFVGSAPNIYSWHGTTSTATGPAAPCQSQNSQLVCGKYLKQEVQFRHL